MSTDYLIGLIDTRHHEDEVHINTKGIEFGQLLDLIDCDRESEEIIKIMNSNGKPEMTGMVCGPLWEKIESRTVNSIQADQSDLLVWLNDEVEIVRDA